MLLCFQVMFLSYIYSNISPVISRVIVLQTSVTAEEQSARCWVVDAKLFIASQRQDTMNGHCKLWKRKEKHEREK